MNYVSVHKCTKNCVAVHGVVIHKTLAVIYKDWKVAHSLPKTECVALIKGSISSKSLSSKSQYPATHHCILSIKIKHAAFIFSISTNSVVKYHTP